jgi:hypothetical protein
MHSLFAITTGSYGDRWYYEPLILPEGGLRFDRFIAYYAHLVCDDREYYGGMGYKGRSDWNAFGPVDEFFYGLILNEAKACHFSLLVGAIRRAIRMRDTIYQGEPKQYSETLLVLADRYMGHYMKAIITKRDFQSMIDLFYDPFSVGEHAVAPNTLYQICDWTDMRWLLPVEGDDDEMHKIAITYMLICIFSLDGAEILRQIGVPVLAGMFPSLEFGWVRLLCKLYPDYCKSVGLNKPGPYFVFDGEPTARSGPPNMCVQFALDSYPGLFYRAREAKNKHLS